MTRLCNYNIGSSLTQQHISSKRFTHASLKLTLSIYKVNLCGRRATLAYPGQIALQHRSTVSFRNFFALFSPWVKCVVFRIYKNPTWIVQPRKNDESDRQANGAPGHPTVPMGWPALMTPEGTMHMVHIMATWINGTRRLSPPAIHNELYNEGPFYLF